MRSSAVVPLSSIVTAALVCASGAPASAASFFWNYRGSYNWSSLAISGPPNTLWDLSQGGFGGPAPLPMPVFPGLMSSDDVVVNPRGSGPFTPNRSGFSQPTAGPWGPDLDFDAAMNSLAIGGSTPIANQARVRGNGFDLSVGVGGTTVNAFGQLSITDGALLGGNPLVNHGTTTFTGVAPGGAVIDHGTPITNHGTLNLGGSITTVGTGTDLVNAPGGLVNFTGSAQLLRGVSNAGTASLNADTFTTGSSLVSMPSGVFTNQPTDEQVQARLDLTGSDAPAELTASVIVNDGVTPGLQAGAARIRLNASGVFGETRLLATLDNRAGGSVEVLSGPALLQQAGADHTNAGSLTVASGAEFTASGASFTNQTAGSVSGRMAFDCDFLNSGSIALDGLTEPMVFQGAFSQDFFGEANLEISALTSHDSIVLMTNFNSFGGALNIHFIDGYEPDLGDEFTLILALGPRSGSERLTPPWGAFDSVSVFGLTGGYSLDTSDLAEYGTVRVVPAPGASAALTAFLAAATSRPRRRAGARPV